MVKWALKVSLSHVGDFLGTFSHSFYDTDQFRIYAPDVRHGDLRITIEGPGEVFFHCSNRQSDAFNVYYVCAAPGEYLITIKYGEEHVPGSPFKSVIRPPNEDLSQLTIRGVDNERPVVNQPCLWVLNTNGMRGRVHARVIAPSGDEEICALQQTREGFGIRFIPAETGVHRLKVRFNGRTVPGTPVEIAVEQSNADPHKVVVSGTGLHSGETGKYSERWTAEYLCTRFSHFRRKMCIPGRQSQRWCGSGLHAHRWTIQNKSEF